MLFFNACEILDTVGTFQVYMSTILKLKKRTKVILQNKSHQASYKHDKLVCCCSNVQQIVHALRVTIHYVSKWWVYIFFAVKIFSNRYIYMYLHTYIHKPARFLVMLLQILNDYIIHFFRNSLFLQSLNVEIFA